MPPALPTPTTFRFDVVDRVATITLDRPERKNPLTFETYPELIDTFRALPEADDVRAVVLTGAGGNFCSGADVRDILGPLADKSPAEQRKFITIKSETERPRPLSETDAKRLAVPAAQAA